MIKFFKKHKLKIIVSLFCSFALSLFTILSFNCKTYAYSIDSNGNLVGDNVFDVNSVLLGNGYDYQATATDWVKAIDIPVLPNTTYASSSSIGRYAFNHGNIVSGYNQRTITTSNDTNSLSVFIYVGDFNGTPYQWFSSYMLNIGDVSKPWEPYGVWYSESNYNTQVNLYNTINSQYNDLSYANNYGYWKYIDYVEFDVNYNTIYVPNTDEQNEWSINDLYNNNILRVGGYFDTTPLTLPPYQNNYDAVRTYINFKGNTPSESFIVSFSDSDSCNVAIYDENGRVFTTQISETNYLIDITKIREYLPNFGLYIIDMYITPNNAEQNGIYFANNDYITAYNKGYNVATSNADRTYIPQINDLQGQVNDLKFQINDLNININTLKTINDELQESLNNNLGWQSLFFAMADTPIRTVSNVLGFELFGLNLFSTFIGMVTVFAIVFLLKKFI